MKRIELYCSVVGGVLDLDKNALTRQLKALKDGQYQLTIEAEPNNISHQQRKYFFGVVVKHLQLGFADAGTAITQQEVIDYLKHYFLFREVGNPIDGEVLKVPISLSNSSKGLTKDEFTKFKDAIQHHAITEWGIDIPEPNEIDYSTK
jgi:hypothetical protein